MNEMIVFPNLPNGLMDEHRKEYVVKSHDTTSCALEVCLGSSVYRCELNCSPDDIARADHIVFMLERGGEWITATSNSVRCLANGVKLEVKTEPPPAVPIVSLKPCFTPLELEEREVTGNSKIEFELDARGSLFAVLVHITHYQQHQRTFEFMQQGSNESVKRMVKCESDVEIVIPWNSSLSSRTLTCTVTDSTLPKVTTQPMNVGKLIRHSSQVILLQQKNLSIKSTIQVSGIWKTEEE